MVGANAELKRYAQAEQWQKRILQRDPDQLSAWQQLAALQQMAGQHGKSLATLRTAYSRGMTFQQSDLDRLIALAAASDQPWQAARLMKGMLESGLLTASTTNQERLAQLHWQARDYSNAAQQFFQLAQQTGKGQHWLSLEVLGDEKTLFPNMPETLKAAALLVKDNFDVMVYCSDDPIQARMLEEIGCVAVMPLASLIGSGMGILNPWNLSLIIDQAKIPVIVDAGVGTASDAAIAMELGCDGVLMNSAISHAREPVQMARAMRLAVQAGRLAYLAGRIPRKFAASPSSPMAGRVQ
ncbi:MAG: hypothetical protein ABI351_12475 [Herbaspirillum sp.]